LSTQAQELAEPRPVNGAAAAEPETETPLLDAAVEAQHQRDLAKLNFEEKRFDFQQRRARLFSCSGLFAVKGVDGQQAIAQAMVKIELGESMGFSPAEALQGINVINGVTAISAAMRAARMQAAGYSWEIDWLGTEQECTGCRLWLYIKGKPLMKQRRDDGGQPLYSQQDGTPIMEHVSVAYTKADAQKMLTTVWENNEKKRVSILEKDNWKMSPKNMYFARAITNAQRWHAPAALSINLPSVEEALDMESAPAVPSGIHYGTHDEQESVAERRIRELGGETKDEHDARLERQMDEQAAAGENPPVAETKPFAPPEQQGQPGQPKAAEEPAQAQQKPSLFARPKFGQGRR
jgi:hypothetical protein